MRFSVDGDRNPSEFDQACLRFPWARPVIRISRRAAPILMQPEYSICGMD
jgi:hypothetical protein